MILASLWLYQHLQLTQVMVLLNLSVVDTLTQIGTAAFVTHVAKLLLNPNPSIKRQSSLLLAKLAKVDAVQVWAKEAGILTTLMSLISATDTVNHASASICIAALARSGLYPVTLENNSAELVRLGVLDELFRDIQGEDKESRREALGALVYLCGNGNIGFMEVKVRSRLHGTPDLISLLIKLVSNDDEAISINSTDCLTAYGEESSYRIEVIKSGALLAMVTNLEVENFRMQSCSCLAITCFLQECYYHLILSGRTDCALQSRFGDDTFG